MMPQYRLRTLVLSMVVCSALPSVEGLSNADTDAWGKHVQVGDGIFPPEPAAASAIAFNNVAFLDHGAPAFVASASIHYARVPRELWEDRVVRLKRLGYTWIETYVFWNFHEPVEGQVDFSGQRDLPAFLALCQQHGLRVLLRVGPYSCAEWTEGGFPSWLRTRPGMRLRVDDARYFEAVSRWFDALLPVVAAAQIHRGGPVAMLQLENEHPHGGGTEANPNGRAYFGLLRTLARRNGIEVPYFFSGLHHNHDPAGETPWDSTTRANPWLSTEFWTTWYSDRGPGKPEVVTRKTRSLWKMIAFGAAGFNCYMAHGGTTFGAWNNDEAEASYDFGAPLGQIGDVRPSGHRLRHANLFATTCADLLLTAQRTEAGTAPAAGIRRWDRRSPRGTISFFDNPGEKAQRVAVPGAGELVLQPGEIAPVLVDARIDPAFTVVACSGRVLARLDQGTTTTLALRVAADETASITVRADGLAGADADGTRRLALTGGDAPVVHELSAGGRTLRVVSVGPALADRTWVVADGGTPVLVVGCGLPLSLSAERLVAEGGGTQAFCYGAGPVVVRRPQVPTAAQTVPALAPWQGVGAVAEAAPGFDDHDWPSNDEPQQMGLAGGIPGAAWYRTVIERSEPGRGFLRLAAVADRAQVYLDGRLLGVVDAQRDAVAVDLAPGRHQVSIYASHGGRDKLFFNTGVMASNSRKGLYGAPRLLVPGSGGGPVAGWRWRSFPNDGKPAAADLEAATEGAPWADVAWGSDLFNRSKGRALAVARFPTIAGGQMEIRFPAIDDEAEVWCNGVRLGSHRGWKDPFTLNVPAKALRPEGNVLAVLVTNGDGAGGMSGAPVVATWDPMPGSGDGVLRTWRQRDVSEHPPQQGFAPFTTATGVPTYYRTTLNLPSPTDGRQWRLGWGTLGRGQVWLNGQALGRYPDRIDPRGLWLPPCWLAAGGTNEVVVFDETGRDPGQVRVVPDGEAPGAAFIWQ